MSSLEEIAKTTPGLVAALERIIERRERSGRLPRSVTLAATPAVADALRRIFSARAVVATGDDRVRIDIAAFLKGGSQSGPELEARLYAGIGREPRDPGSASRALRGALESGLVKLEQAARCDASRAFVRAELRTLGDAGGDLVRSAEQDGTDHALAVARNVVRSIDALEGIRDPVRVQNFSARVLGSSKVLRPGTELWQRVGAALVDHDAATQRALVEQGVPPRRTTQIQRALEVNGVYHDELAASVLCFGPLVYTKRGERFDFVARHTRFGESSRLIAHQLRDATFSEPEATRITVLENLAPYLDYVDACVERAVRDEIVICSSGQASWAVVSLLAGLGRFRVPARHAGDLDRSGVLILRSLARRSGVRLAPVLMDPVTHARFASRGRALESDERGRLARLVATDDPSAPCHELLGAILATQTWIEQEQLTEELLHNATTRVGMGLD